MNKSTPRIVVRICLALAIAMVDSVAVAGTVEAEHIASPIGPLTPGGTGEYDSASFDIFLSPVSTDWIALSMNSTLQTGLPNLSGIPSIRSIETFDNIWVTLSKGGNTSSTITLDDNDGNFYPIGN